MWDGKLYVDGNENTTPYYTQASDVFMQATIHWNPLSPSKPWENVDSNTFDEDRYAIIASDGIQRVSSSPTNFAWINAGSATTPPTMPALSARLAANGCAQIPAYLFWKLTITFARPDKTAADISTYPASGVTQLPGGATWYPYFGTDIRGGEALLQSFTSSGPFYSLTHKVHIRGLNPDDAAAVTYINAHNTDSDNFSHWYAWGIARHETKTWMPVEVPPNPEYTTFPNDIFLTDPQVGAAYNQFIPYRFFNRLPNQNPDEDGYPGSPKHRHDPPHVGYGMMQITIDPATAEEVWNWQANVNRAIVILKGKRDVAQAFEDAVYRTFRPDYGSGYRDAPQNNFGFCSMDAATVQGYNGFAGREYLVDPNGAIQPYKSCWILQANTTTPPYVMWGDWIFVDNSQNYVRRIARMLGLI
jgi:hypothetical protein